MKEAIYNKQQNKTHTHKTKPKKKQNKTEKPPRGLEKGMSGGHLRNFTKNVGTELKLDWISRDKHEEPFDKVPFPFSFIGQKVPP